METTRHFTATLYVVESGAVALHEHPKLGVLAAPGGHVDRGELPHEAALREAGEELGRDPRLLPVASYDGVESPAGRSLPRPRHQMLYDVDVVDGEVAHQHVDHVYFAAVDGRDIDPDPGEAPADAWSWFDRAALDPARPDLDRDVAALGREAIVAAERADR